MLGVVGIQLQIGGFDSIKSDWLHLGVDHLWKIEFPLAVCRVHISLELIIGYLVSFLVFTVAIAVFLDGVICQVDYWLAYVLDVELVWWGADVALAEPICSHCSMQARDEHIMSNIEFPVFVEQRFLNIFLNYICFLRSIEMLLFFLEDIV